MTDAELHEIAREASQVIRELLEQTELREHSVLVVGCSSSEILGGHIGKIGSMEVADAVYQGIAPVLQEKGIDLAAQCCEHLNRAVIVERACALRNGYEIVSVCPWPHAGGSWATTCWQHFEDPVAVEEVRADAGIDILVGEVVLEQVQQHVQDAFFHFPRPAPTALCGWRSGSSGLASVATMFDRQAAL